MRKTVLVVLAALVLTGAAWADLEIGAGISPPLAEKPEELKDEKSGPLGDAIISFHGGFSKFWLYASADAYILPPFVVRQFTTTVDEQGYVKDGVYRPGFLTLFDAGFRPKIGPIAISITAGINTFYIYRQKDMPDDAYKPSLGVNMRFGLYVFLARHFAITATGTTVFPNFDALTSTLKALGGDDEFLKQQAIDLIVGNLYPTVSLIIDL